MNEVWTDEYYDRSVLARAPSKNLDEASELDLFGAAFVVDYEWRDPQAALSNLSSFVHRGGRLALLRPSGDNAVFDGLVERFGHSVTVLERSRNVTRDLGLVLDALEVETRNPPAKAAPGSLEVRHGKNQIEVAVTTFAETQDRPLPLYIKSSFFPFWRSSSGAPVFLASPANMLVMSQKGRETLVFDASRATNAGAGLSGATLLIALFVGRLTERKAS